MDKALLTVMFAHNIFSGRCPGMSLLRQPLMAVVTAAIYVLKKVTALKRDFKPNISHILLQQQGLLSLRKTLANRK